MKVAILGYGKEGKAAEKYFRARGDEVEVFEKCDEADLDKIDFSCYNEVIRSPSVRPRDGFSSVTKYFFAHCPAPIIGVTGTKGKGTTCSMIVALLKALGRKAVLVGNIGIPAIEKLDEIKPDEVVVYELSSFQLWDLTQSPQVAVVLRIAPDHLNVHKDFAEYIEAKSHITEFQRTGDSVVYFRGSAEARAIAEKSRGRKVPYPAIEAGTRNGAAKSGAENGVTEARSEVEAGMAELEAGRLSKRAMRKLQGVLDALTVPGAHNREDAEAALAAVAAFLGMSLEELVETHAEELRKGLAGFKGLPHHIEFVRELRGVEYYDDSFSTAEPALEVAVQAFPGRPLVLIAGGQDKGVDLSETKRIIFGAPELRRVFLLGEIAGKLAEGEDPEKYTAVQSLAEAVEGAQKVAEEASADVDGGSAAGAGPVVLLSPGAASLDMFESYYVRGDEFQRLVRGLG